MVHKGFEFGTCRTEVCDHQGTTVVVAQGCYCSECGCAWQHNVSPWPFVRVVPSEALEDGGQA